MLNDEKMEILRKELCEFLVNIDNKEEMRLFLDDLCTYNELDQMAQRLFAAKLFLKGETYTQIRDLTDISSATLSRVSRCIRHGSGGYSKVLRGKMDK